MELQIIISSINRQPIDINSETIKYPNLIVINQIPNKLDLNINEENINGLRWINIDQKGLSKSRNHALEISEADIIYLTDDDIVLKENFREIVIKSFIDNPEIDILAFNIKGIEEEFKKEVTKEKKIGFLGSMKLSSVQLVYKQEFIKKNNIKFDELFGAGSKYTMGEENIFLFDALKKGAKIKFIPQTIAKLHIGKSTWFEGLNSKYLFDKGASFWRMFGWFAPVYSLTYCVRKRNEYKKYLSFFEAYRQTLYGMKDYLKNKEAN